MDQDEKIRKINSERELKMRKMMGDLEPAGDPDLHSTHSVGTFIDLRPPIWVDPEE